MPEGARFMERLSITPDSEWHGDRSCISRIASSAISTQALVILLTLTVIDATAHAQERVTDFVRVLRLSGTFSHPAEVKVVSNIPARPAPVELTNAKIEADPIGALTRVRPLLTITNRDPDRVVRAVEWELVVYDEVVRNANNTLMLKDELKIRPGASGTASIRAAAVLPDRMRILVQLTRVLFTDGSEWSPDARCSLSSDLATLTCESMNEHK